MNEDRTYEAWLDETNHRAIFPILLDISKVISFTFKRFEKGILRWRSRWQAAAAGPPHPQCPPVRKPSCWQLSTGSGRKSTKKRRLSMSS